MSLTAGEISTQASCVSSQVSPGTVTGPVLISLKTSGQAEFKPMNDSTQRPVDTVFVPFRIRPAKIARSDCRRNSLALVGRMKVNAEPVTSRKAQKSTGSTTFQNGTSQTGDPRGFQKGGSTKARTPKEEWKWQKRYCDAPSKANGTGVFSVWKSGVREAQELEHASRKVQRPRCH